MATLSDPRFDFLSLNDLRVMLRDVLKLGPNAEDHQFIRDLANEIAQREKVARQ